MNAGLSPSASVDPKQVQVLQLIYAALAAGMVLPGAVLLAIGIRGDAGVDNPSLFSVLHGGFALSTWIFAPVLFRLILQHGGTSTARVSTKSGRQPGIAAAYIVRAALFEAPAFFGLVVLVLIGGQQLADQPVYWANLASPAVFLLLLAATFPTTDRLQALQREFDRERK